MGQKENEGTYLVGITHHAQDSLGDVTFVELPARATPLSKIRFWICRVRKGRIRSLHADWR